MWLEEQDIWPLEESLRAESEKTSFSAVGTGYRSSMTTATTSRSSASV